MKFIIQNKCIKLKIKRHTLYHSIIRIHENNKYSNKSRKQQYTKFIEGIDVLASLKKICYVLNQIYFPLVLLPAKFNRTKIKFQLPGGQMDTACL